MMIFEAFYALNRKQQPLSRDQMITYVWLGQALLGLLPWGIDAELKEKIRSGGVVYDLLRPLDLYFHWCLPRIAARTAPTLQASSIPLFIIAGMFRPESASRRWSCYRLARPHAAGPAVELRIYEHRYYIDALDGIRRRY